MSDQVSISDRERHDRIVALAGQVTWIRAAGGRVLRAEMVGDQPILEVEDDPLFSGFNRLSGVAPSDDYPIVQSGGFPASWERRKVIAQVGALFARGQALSGCEPCCGWRLPSDYDITCWPGTVAGDLFDLLSSQMDIDEHTQENLRELIIKQVQFTLFENWLSLHSVAFLIYANTANRLIEIADECRIIHPYMISAEAADQMWREAEQITEDCLLMEND